MGLLKQCASGASRRRDTRRAATCKGPTTPAIQNVNETRVLRFDLGIHYFFALVNWSGNLLPGKLVKHGAS